MKKKKNFVASFIESKSGASKTVYDDQQFAKLKLDNGLTLISQNMPHLRSISIGVWVLVGSRYEKPAQMGISHFIEHSVFKGTRKRSALKIAKVLEEVGGSLNAFTSKENTCYYANILSEDLSLAVDVLADLVTGATFGDKEMEKEKLVVAEEIRDNEDSPEEYIQDEFYSALFPNHPLGFNILGTQATVQNFTRDAVENYYRKYYVPSNMIVSVAGHFDQAKLEALVTKRFRFLKAHNNRSYWPSGFKTYSARAFKGRRRRISKKISQAHVCMGFPLRMTYDHLKKFEMLALNTIIGGGMSSRLFQRIRERNGLAYSIYSFLDFMYDIGLFGVYLATDKKKVDRTVEKVKDELRRLISQPIRPHELKMAKSQIKASLLFGLESTSTRMIRLAKNEIYLRRKLNVAELASRVDRMRIDDVESMARMIADRVDSMQVTVLS